MRGPGGVSPADAVRQDREQSDDDACEQALPELRLAQPAQHLVPDVVAAAHEGREDHQREGGHDGLVQPQEQSGAGARKADPPQHLPVRHPRHARGLHHLRGDPRVAENHRTRDRRNGVDCARHDRHHRRHAEEQQHRDDVGEGGHRLHEVQERFDETAHRPVSECDHPQHQAREHRERYREADQGQSEHCLAPVADDQHVGERCKSQEREARAARVPGQDQECAEGDWPRHPVQCLAQGDEGDVQHPGDGAEQPARVVDQPVHRGVDPEAEGDDVLFRILRQPRHVILKREQDEAHDPDP